MDTHLPEILGPLRPGCSSNVGSGPFVIHRRPRGRAEAGQHRNIPRSGEARGCHGSRPYHDV